MAKSCAIPKSAFPLKFQVKSPVHALELARKLVRPFKRWTQNYLALDADGDHVAPKSSKAEAFCALGALLRVNTKHQKKAKKFLEIAACRVEGFDDEDADEDWIFSVNDGAGDKANHRQVMKMFATAIRIAKKAAASK